MAEEIKQIKSEGIMQLLNEKDVKDYYEKTSVMPDSKDLHDAIKELLDIENISNKAVLGIDIYRYSAYQDYEQALIPLIFKVFFFEANKFCLESDQFIFQNYSKDEIEKYFISTGDGGFLIFDSPLHALVFAINFEMTLRTYNSFHLYPKLRRMVGEISLRYAMTFDKVYAYENRCYGRAIINNSRILFKDNLNRFLIDENTHHWFLLNTDGVENLRMITLKEISNIHEFEKYDKTIIKSGKNIIFFEKVMPFSGITRVDILKIGKIKSTETDLNIYNLYLQVAMLISDEKDPSKFRNIITSLGNLNISGIS